MLIIYQAMKLKAGGVINSLNKDKKKTAKQWERLVWYKKSFNKYKIKIQSDKKTIHHSLFQSISSPFFICAFKNSMHWWPPIGDGVYNTLIQCVTIKWNDVSTKHVACANHFFIVKLHGLSSSCLLSIRLMGIRNSSSGIHSIWKYSVVFRSPGEQGKV
jgi:hypothetical protein